MKKISLIVVLIGSFMISACKQGTKEYVHIGPNWAALNAMQPSEKTFKVSVKAVRSAILGDLLTLKVKSEKPGLLWILQVDSNDETSLIFPNKMAEDNQLEAGRWKKIPGEGASWSIEAMTPTGPSVVVFIVTVPGTDIRTVLNDQPQQLDKALRLVENAPAWGLAKQVIDIQEK